MATEYYTPSGTPSQGAFGASAPMRAELQLIDAAFQKLPVMAGHANEVVVVNGAGTALIATDTLENITLINPVFSGSISVDSLSGDPDVDIFCKDQTDSIVKGLQVGQEVFVNQPTAPSTHYIRISPGPGGTIIKVEPNVPASGAAGMYFYSRGVGAAQTFASEVGGPDENLFIIYGEANAVNHIGVVGTPAGVAPIFRAEGIDTNVGITYSAQGAGSHSFQTGGGTQVEIVDGWGGSTVHRLELSGSTASQAPYIAAVGSSSNISAALFAKGNGGAIEFWHYRPSASDVKLMSFYSEGAPDVSTSTRRVLAFASTGGARIIPCDTESGDLLIGPPSSTWLQLTNPNAPTAAVNFLTFSAGAAANPVQISSNGSDSDVELRLTTKGTAAVVIDRDCHIRGASAPPNEQSANYTLVLDDANRSMLHPASDNNPRTFTIPSNAAVAYRVGTMLTFANLVNTVTIAINSDTLIQEGTGSTGSRTLPANRIATALKVAATTWMIGGAD